MFWVPFPDCTSFCLVALNTVWYCWEIFFNWQSKLAFLISSCSCCCPSSDKLFLLHWWFMLSLKVQQFWKFSMLCNVEVFEGVAVNFFFYHIYLNFTMSYWKSIRTDCFIIVASFFRSSFNLQTFTREICLITVCSYVISVFSFCKMAGEQSIVLLPSGFVGQGAWIAHKFLICFYCHIILSLGC